ncbi:hypothetical protein BD309DRAFT_481269 [Dichomitus squalens]|nr:hypothetical protein BD309DRAFT_481269 [Dichomitus squalens]
MSSSGSPTTALPHISIDTSIGAMLIGTFITLILYGVIVHQVYRYSRIYSSDKAGIKFAVYATFILETFHTTLSCHACYYYLVSNYLNPSVLLYPTRTLQIIPLVTGMIVVTAQGFFARRAYIFGRQYRILVCIAVCFLIGELGCCIGGCKGISHDYSFSNRSQLLLATTIVEIQSGPFTSFVPKTVRSLLLSVIISLSCMLVGHCPRIGPSSCRRYYFDDRLNHRPAPESQWYQIHGLVGRCVGPVYYYYRLCVTQIQAVR